MKKPNSFIYINLNSLIGKYTAACLFVGNIVMVRAAVKAVKNLTKKSYKKENDQ